MKIRKNSIAWWAVKLTRAFKTELLPALLMMALWVVLAVITQSVTGPMYR